MKSCEYLIAYIVSPVLLLRLCQFKLLTFVRRDKIDPSNSYSAIQRCLTVKVEIESIPMC